MLYYFCPWDVMMRHSGGWDVGTSTTFLRHPFLTLHINHPTCYSNSPNIFHSCCYQVIILILYFGNSFFNLKSGPLRMEEIIGLRGTETMSFPIADSRIRQTLQVQSQNILENQRLLIRDCSGQVDTAQTWRPNCMVSISMQTPSQKRREDKRMTIHWPNLCHIHNIHCKYIIPFNVYHNLMIWL